MEIIYILCFIFLSVVIFVLGFSTGYNKGKLEGALAALDLKPVAIKKVLKSTKLDLGNLLDPITPVEQRLSKYIEKQARQVKEDDDA